MLPNFIIVGAAKSGTTSLYYYLKQHPEIYLPAYKEPHFFANANMLGIPTINSLKDYEELFSGVTNESAIGEASTGYLYFDESAELIKNYIPDCKIIIILRNPIERAFSMYSHEVREGLENQSFMDAIMEEIEHGSRKKRVEDFGFNYVKLGFTYEKIVRYIELFGDENVFVGFYDDLKENVNELMSKLFAFLNVNDHFIGDWTTVHNPSGEPKIKWLHKILNNTSTIRRVSVYPFKLIVPKEARHNIWRSIKDWNVNMGAKNDMDKEARNILLPLYLEEIKKIEDLVKKDLSIWYTN